MENKNIETNTSTKKTINDSPKTYKILVHRSIKAKCYARARKEGKTLDQFICDIVSADFEVIWSKYKKWEDYKEGEGSYLTVTVPHIYHRLWVKTSMENGFKLSYYITSKVETYINNLI